MRNCRRARPARYRCRRHKHTRAHTHTHTHTHEHNSTHTRAHTQHATPAHRPRTTCAQSCVHPSLDAMAVPLTTNSARRLCCDMGRRHCRVDREYPARPPHNCRSRGRRPGRGLHGVSCPGAPAPSDTYPRRGEVDEQDPPRVSVGSQRRPVLTFVRASGATPAQAGPLVGCWMAGRPAGHCCCS